MFTNKYTFLSIQPKEQIQLRINLHPNSHYISASQYDAKPRQMSKDKSTW